MDKNNTYKFKRKIEQQFIDNFQKQITAPDRNVLLQI